MLNDWVVTVDADAEELTFPVAGAATRPTEVAEVARPDAVSAAATDAVETVAALMAEANTATAATNVRVFLRKALLAGPRRFASGVIERPLGDPAAGDFGCLSATRP